MLAHERTIRLLHLLAVTLRCGVRLRHKPPPSQIPTSTVESRTDLRHCGAQKLRVKFRSSIRGCRLSGAQAMGASFFVVVSKNGDHPLVRAFRAVGDEVNIARTRPVGDEEGASSIFIGLERNLLQKGRADESLAVQRTIPRAVSRRGID